MNEKLISMSEDLNEFIATYNDNVQNNNIDGAITELNCIIDMARILKGKLKEMG